MMGDRITPDPEAIRRREEQTEQLPVGIPDTGDLIDPDADDPTDSDVTDPDDPSFCEPADVKPAEAP